MGLVEVELPAGTRRGTLDVSWSVPGARIQRRRGRRGHRLDDRPAGPAASRLAPDGQDARAAAGDLVGAHVAWLRAGGRPSPTVGVGTE